MNPINSLFELSLSGDAFEWSKCRWLAKLRWVMLSALGLLLIPLYVSGFLNIQRFIWMLGLTSLGLIANLLWQLNLQKRQSNLNPTVIGFNLLGDLAILSLAILWTGAVESPFFYSFILLAALSGVLIRPRESWVYLTVLILVVTLFYLHHLYFERKSLNAEMKIEWLFYSGLIAASWSLFRSFGVVIERQARIQMREMESLQVRDKLRSLGALTAGFSHEFASPLFTIKSSVERIERQLSKCNTQGAGESVKDALLGVQDCEGVIRRMNASQLDPLSWNYESADIVQLIRQTLRSLEYRDKIEFQGPETLQVVLPRIQFVQVLMNVLDNAAEVSPRIALSLQLQGGWVQLKVTDWGGGFDESVLRFLGEPFRTTKEHGTGLGLYLSRLFCENMGGSLSVASSSEGAVVHLRWPEKGDL